MKYRKLGTSDIEVSEVSLGCWTLGGLNWVNGVPNGWADVDEKEVRSAVRWALNNGVNHFDNADVYGNGRAEQMLGRSLGRRNKDVVIATKVGHFPGTATHAYDALHIRSQCEQSLKNLQRDYLDIYYFHHGNFGARDCYLPEALETVHRLRDEGKIRVIGLSAYSNDDFERLVPKIEPTVLQSWANALDDCFIREGSLVRELLVSRKMSFVAFTPLGQGLLLGKYDPRNPPTFDAGDQRRGNERFGKEYLTKLAPKIAKLKDRFGSDTGDLVGMALQYILHEPVVGCVIPGFRNTEQVQMNVSTAGKPMSDADAEYVRDVLRD
jgi:myo-inositol catabolism protein IolS